MRNLLLRLFDPNKAGSLSARCRAARNDFFLKQLNKISKSEINVLDLGGTVNFWKKITFDPSQKAAITVLNLTALTSDKKYITTVAGDARDLSQFKDRSFDIVFSNSVIEHLGTFQDQKKMADEVRRVGINYFIQTPNYYFPMEPHFLFPFFQFFPLAWKIFLVRHFSLGHYQKKPVTEEAVIAIKQIRLLKQKELRELFPNANIYLEKVLGLTKSFIAYRF